MSPNLVIWVLWPERNTGNPTQFWNWGENISVYHSFRRYLWSLSCMPGSILSVGGSVYKVRGRVQIFSYRYHMLVSPCYSCRDVMPLWQWTITITIVIRTHRVLKHWVDNLRIFLKVEHLKEAALNTWKKTFMMSGNRNILLTTIKLYYKVMMC